MPVLNKIQQIANYIHTSCDVPYIILCCTYHRPVFDLWLNKVSVNERRLYMCNVFCQLRPCPGIDKTMGHISWNSSHSYMYIIYIYIYIYYYYGPACVAALRNLSKWTEINHEYFTWPKQSKTKLRACFMDHGVTHECLVQHIKCVILFYWQINTISVE